MIFEAFVIGVGLGIILAMATRPLSDRLLASNPERLRIEAEPPVAPGDAVDAATPGAGPAQSSMLRPLLFALHSQGFRIVGTTTERWPLGLREGRSLVLLSSDERISAGVMIHLAFLKLGPIALAEVPSRPFWVLTSVLASGRQVRTNSNAGAPVIADADLVYGGANGEDVPGVIAAHEAAIARTGETVTTFHGLDGSIAAARAFLRTRFMRARMQDGARDATATWAIRSLKIAAITAGVAFLVRFLL